MAVASEQHLLVLRAQTGDTEAFAALVAARRSPLLLLVAAAIGDWDEAEDALQDALWRAFTGLRTLREPAAFDGWLRRLVLNVARDHLRAGLSRLRREGRPAGGTGDIDRLLAATERLEEGSVAGADALAALADRDGCAVILAAIGTLPPLQRQAGRLAWIAGVPPLEVAGLLGISRDGLHAALHRGRRRLGAMFYARGDWRKDVAGVPEGAVTVGGIFLRERVQRLRQLRPEPPIVLVDGDEPPAQMRMRVFWGQAPGRGPAPPPAQALPLDRLADAAGLDLEPFGTRLARYTHAGRPHWLPYADAAHLVLYNADLLARAGLRPPAADWTWDDFFGYCRRCAAAGLAPTTAYTPNAWDVAIVAEELGATRDHVDPVREAIAFVRDWRRQGWAAPVPEPDWLFGQFLAGGCVFFMLQYGHSPSLLRESAPSAPLRWGVAPLPRFRRDDPPVRYWFHEALELRGTAPDPVAAFGVAQAMLIEGWAPEGDFLPAYRTPARMRAWAAQELPLGKACVLELDAATDPLHEAEHLCVLPGAGEALQAALEGEIDAAACVARVAAGVAAHRAGQPLEMTE